MTVVPLVGGLPLRVEPVILTGRRVRLEPVSLSHVSDLAHAGRDESVWRLMPYGLITTEERMTGFVRSLLERKASGKEFPFAVVHRDSGRAIGSTRFLDVRSEHRGLEIGGTWYDPAHQRTGVNTECKLLLLRHAFEVLGALRVQFKTDLRNERSQRAIERIGGVREGVLRDHMILPDGYVRSSVYYSIIASEWSSVRERLERMAEPR